MAEVYILNKFEPNPYPHAVEIDTTSKGPFKDLSPFYLGPLKDPLTGQICQNVENFWQYSKVYAHHVDANGAPIAEYWNWREAGFNNTRAVRYPAGKGAKPVGSLNNKGFLVGYIEARKQLYTPCYSELARCTTSYAQLYSWFHGENRALVLRDFDGYNYIKMNMSLVDVINNPNKVMGHSFVLAGMLTGQIQSMLQ